jgi:hypothetical protein
MLESFFIWVKSYPLFFLVFAFFFNRYLMVFLVGIVSGIYLSTYNPELAATIMQMTSSLMAIFQETINK